MMSKLIAKRFAIKKIACYAMFTPAIALFGLSAAGCSETRLEFKSVDLTGAQYARELNLTDTEGRQRSLKDFAGKVVVVFFGFAQCPDVCPTTMAEVAEAKKLLGAQGDKLQGVFVSIDPERDTPEVLKAYMANFDPTFVALRGTAEQTAAAAKEFKVFYKKVEGKTATSYTMEHSTGSYVFDPQGRVRLYTRYQLGAQALADDIQLLLKS
jgi:protein SCO1